MKIIFTLIIIGVILACNTNKTIVENNVADKSASNCPDDGVCTFDVIKNKTFRIKADEFGNSYSELLDGNKTILKFEYKRNTSPEIQDANYSEIIYIEIENNTKALSLKDGEIGKANIGFSRLCFCRGQTGTYPISSGSLNLSKTDNNTYTLNFDFKVSEVPQIITTINETFEL